MVTAHIKKDLLGLILLMDMRDTKYPVMIAKASAGSTRAIAVLPWIQEREIMTGRAKSSCCKASAQAISMVSVKSPSIPDKIIVRSIGKVLNNGVMNQPLNIGDTFMLAVASSRDLMTKNERAPIATPERIS